MSKLGDAIREVIRKDDFADFSEDDLIWRIGGLTISHGTIAGRAFVTHFAEFGFEYIGKRAGKFIFKKQIDTLHEPEKHTLREIYDMGY
jgi:hypothetical protein